MKATIQISLITLGFLELNNFNNYYNIWVNMIQIFIETLNKFEQIK